MSSPVLKRMQALYWAEYHTPLERVIYTDHLGANQLVKEDTTAFLIASALDRGGKANLIWQIPYRLKSTWGHLDTKKIQAFNSDTLASDPIVASIPSRISRKQLARTIISVADVIERYHDGQAQDIFTGTTNEMLFKLQRISGVGPGIARMAVILRILHFGLRPNNDGMLLPKLDVHVQRLMLRTGLVSNVDDDTVRTALAGLDDRQISAIDNVMWGLGQSHCLPSTPRCGDCPISMCCPKVGI